MIRRPPRSTLFPTRRSSDLCRAENSNEADSSCTAPQEVRPKDCARVPVGLGRSEEHTSELQSRRDLVCRLLLEKKNLLQQTSQYVTRMKSEMSDLENTVDHN